MSRAALILLILVGCAGTKRVATIHDHDDDDEEIQIRIESVGIGDPCAGQPTCATPVVRVALRNGIHPAKVRVRSVTVTGSEGRTLTLTASRPTVFTSRGLYESWDETIGADQVMAIEYALARVDWDHFSDRADVRATSVIIEVDGRERVFGVETREQILEDELTET